jgi:hypothetical protein
MHSEVTILLESTLMIIWFMATNWMKLLMLACLWCAYILWCLFLFALLVFQYLEEDEEHKGPHQFNTMVSSKSNMTKAYLKRFQARENWLLGYNTSNHLGQKQVQHPKVLLCCQIYQLIQICCGSNNLICH